MNQPLAYVHPGAKIAKMLSLSLLQPFIQRSYWRWNMDRSNVTIMEGARIGKIVIYFLVQISAVPQDLKFGGEDSLAIIGDNH
jgi:UDP-N-acetylglucosamine acyltransferase